MRILSIQTSRAKSLNVNIQRLFLCFFCLFGFVTLNACYAFNKSAFTIAPDGISNDFMKIKLLDSIRYSGKTLNQLAFTEISDIAWDKDEKLLYAISDEGLLYHITLNIQENKIKKIDLLKAERIKDEKDLPLKGKFSDAEGLTLLNGDNQIQGDSKLIISFENKPRIEQFLLNGQRETKIKIPKKLRKRKTYRHKNNALESVTHHPKHGFLTAAEKSIKKEDETTQVVYSNSGKEWKFKASSDKNSAITALEVLENGDVLILERAYSDPVSPLVIRLRQLKINQCDSHFCVTETLARFSSSDGWSLDNFEGLTHIKGNQYLMVSDDNNNPLQNTLWVLFEINNSIN